MKTETFLPIFPGFRNSELFWRDSRLPIACDELAKLYGLADVRIASDCGYSRERDVLATARKTVRDVTAWYGANLPGVIETVYFLGVDEEADRIRVEITWTEHGWDRLRSYLSNWGEADLPAVPSEIPQTVACEALQFVFDTETPEGSTYRDVLFALSEGDTLLDYWEIHQAIGEQVLEALSLHNLKALAERAGVSYSKLAHFKSGATHRLDPKDCRALLETARGQLAS